MAASLTLNPHIPIRNRLSQGDANQARDSGEEHGQLETGDAFFPGEISGRTRTANARGRAPSVGGPRRGGSELVQPHHAPFSRDHPP